MSAKIAWNDWWEFGPDDHFYDRPSPMFVAAFEAGARAALGAVELAILNNDHTGDMMGRGDAALFIENFAEDWADV